MDPRHYEPDDDPSFSPRSQLLSPETVHSIFQRPTSPAKQERRFSNLPSTSRLDNVTMPVPDLGEQLAERDQRVANAPMDFRTMRRMLRDTSDQLDAVTKRANKAEAHARDARARTFALEVQYRTSREASIKAAEELKLYKAELARAQQEVMRAQAEINNLAAERDRAEADAAKSRDTARKAAERLKIQQAREEGLREGRSQGRREGFVEGQSRAMATAAEDAIAVAQYRANKMAYDALKRVLDEEDTGVRGVNGNSQSRRTSVSSQDQLAPQPGPSRTGIPTLTPIQEAAQEISPAQQSSVPLQMPEPHPAQPGQSFLRGMSSGPVEDQNGASMPVSMFSDQQQNGLETSQPHFDPGTPSFQFSNADPFITAPSPVQRFVPMGSPVPPSLGLNAGGPSGGFSLGLGAPSFLANIIPPTPAPTSPASRVAAVTPTQQPPSMFPEPFEPPPTDFPPAGFVPPVLRAPSPRMPSRAASPLIMQQGMSMPSPGTTVMRDAIQEAVERPERERRRKHRKRQDSIGSVPLVITPASPEESSSSSSEDDAMSRRTSRSSRRAGPSGANLLSPRHIPRPLSRRASPDRRRGSSQSSSPKVEIMDLATGAPIRVSSRFVGEDMLEQEQRDQERAQWEHARRAAASPRLPNVPRMTPGRNYSPLPPNMPPLPPSISPSVRDLPGGNRMSMYGGAPGTARSRASNLPYAAAPSGVAYPGPVSPMPRMSFPPSSGNSTITPIIPGVTVSSGYEPAPFDGPAYPGPVTPGRPARALYDDPSRSPGASTVRLIGPTGSPAASRAGFMHSPIALPSVPPLSRAASPNPFDSMSRSRSPAPSLHPGHTPFMRSTSPAPSLRPNAGQTPFMRPTSPMPSRPPSRFSTTGSMARTDRIRPHELPGTQVYETAPGAPAYPPPPTPARVPIPPSPAMSRRSMRSHVTSATPRVLGQEMPGAMFNPPEGEWSWDR